MDQAETDVLIVGAGPAGMTLAAALNRHGIRFRIVDKDDGPTSNTRAPVLWQRTQEFLAALGIRALWLSESDEVREESLHLYGKPIDALLQRDAASADMTLADWQKVIDVNLMGQFLCVREAVRQFRRQGRRGVSRAAGQVVCMSSVHEAIPWAGHVNHAASKGGVAMMMRTPAQEYAPDGIRINAVAQGAIATPINRDATGGDAGRKLLELFPYGRIGEVEDVARAVCWLVSDEADYLVGTTLFIDGGMTLYPGFQHHG